MIMKNNTHDRQILTLKRKGYEEYFITAKLAEGEPLSSLFDIAARAVRERDACIISQDIFSFKDHMRKGQDFLKGAFGEISWPVTWVEDRTSGGVPGIHVWAVSGIPVEPIHFAGCIIGSLFEDEYARYCRLGGLLPEDPSLLQAEQTQSLFDRMLEVLKMSGLDFSRVFRTWYFNLDILSWYSEFNRVRNAFFTKHGVFNGLVPASTGMAGGNPAGAALQSGLLALEPKSPQSVRLEPVPSPLQCPALEYGSSFSRAVEVTTGDVRRLYISGTASIDQNGKTVYKDEVEKQIEHTFEVVDAILRSRGMSFADSTRSMAYFKRREDISRLEKYCQKFRLDPATVLISLNDICRDDLLFEIEIDAILCLPG